MSIYFSEFVNPCQNFIKLEHFYQRTWGNHATLEFWAWFHVLGAKPGEHLIVGVIDGEAKR